MQRQGASLKQPVSPAPDVAAPRPRASAGHGLVLLTVAGPMVGAVAALTLAAVRGRVEPVALVLLAAGYLVTSVGAEIGFHRCFSHGAFKCRPWLRTFLAVAGSMAGEGPIFFWVSVHRQHHRCSDRPGDPHSPHPAGPGQFVYAHLGWMFDSAALQVRPVPDLMRDRILAFVHRTYLYWLVLGLALPAIIGGWVAGAWGAVDGFLWGGLVRMFVQHQITWSINSVTHVVGTRRYATPDKSRNIALMALPTLGGSWHNNHHAYPASATNDHRWWQFDPGAWLIRCWAFIGAASDLQAPPPRDARILDPPTPLG